MENLTIEQLIEKYPYLRETSKYTLFTTKEETDKIKNSEKISVKGKDISIEFLKRILKDEIYFSYALKYLSREIPKFDVCFILAGDTCGAIGYSKKQIIKGIEKLIISQKINLNEEEKERYEELKRKMKFDVFKEKYRTTNFDIQIDGNDYSIPVMDLISILELSDEEFTKLCNDNEIKNINNIKKEYYIYAAIKFIKENNINNDYLLPENILDRCKDITSLQKIDLEAINHHLETEDTKFKEAKIDEDLERIILSGMPQDASDLEKAIYIYIKMCKVLTYDDEYYAVNQKGPAARKHTDINYVANINPTNNKVVCFEFNLIYSKLLNDLGIHFSSEYKNMVGEVYGEGHANLEFRSGKFLVEADSVTSILQGDIMQAKLNQPLRGLICLNQNEQTKKEFKEAVSKMYKLIVSQEQQQENLQIEHIQTFDELISEYSKTTTNIKEIDLGEKLSILIEKVNSTKMVGIDSLSYVLQLRKILFNEVERKNNIQVTIIRNNQPFDQNKVAMASAIFTLNAQSFEEHPYQNLYFYFNPNHELIPVSLEEIQTKFNEGIFEYVTEEDPRIPGITESGGPKR